MGARSAIQLAFAASTILVIIQATPCHQGHQRRGVVPARAVGDARHQVSLARPIAFVPLSRPASRDVFGQLPLSVEVNAGQVSDGAQLVARGRGDSIALTRAETVLTTRRLVDDEEGHRLRRPVALPECLMPRNSCGYSTEQ